MLLLDSGGEQRPALVELTSNFTQLALLYRIVYCNICCVWQLCVICNWFWHHCPKAIVTLHDSVAFSPCSHAAGAVVFLQMPWVQVTEFGNYSEKYTALLYLRTGLCFSSFLVCFEVKETSNMPGGSSKNRKEVVQGKKVGDVCKMTDPWQPYFPLAPPLFDLNSKGWGFHLKNGEIWRAMLQSITCHCLLSKTGGYSLQDSFWCTHKHVTVAFMYGNTKDG